MYLFAHSLPDAQKNLKSSSIEFHSIRFVTLPPPSSSVSQAKYLRLEEVSSLVRPSDLTQKVVRRWLQSHGVSACLSVLTRDFLQCTMPAQ